MSILRAKNWIEQLGQDKTGIRNYFQLLKSMFFSFYKSFQRSVCYLNVPRCLLYCNKL